RHTFRLSSSLCSVDARPPTQIYPLSLHDALPICHRGDRVGITTQVRGAQHGLPETAAPRQAPARTRERVNHIPARRAWRYVIDRSEEHTSELQSRESLVCRLLLEKKKKKYQRRKL